MTHNHFI